MRPFKLTHYLSEKRRTGTTAIMPVACGGVAVVLRLQTPEVVLLRASVGSTDATSFQSPTVPSDRQIWAVNSGFDALSAFVAVDS